MKVKEFLKYYCNTPDSCIKIVDVTSFDRDNKWYKKEKDVIKDYGEYELDRFYLANFWRDTWLEIVVMEK